MTLIDTHIVASPGEIFISPLTLQVGERLSCRGWITWKCRDRVMPAACFVHVKARLIYVTQFDLFPANCVHVGLSVPGLPILCFLQSISFFCLVTENFSCPKKLEVCMVGHECFYMLDHGELRVWAKFYLNFICAKYISLSRMFMDYAVVFLSSGKIESWSDNHFSKAWQ